MSKLIIVLSLGVALAAATTEAVPQGAPAALTVTLALDREKCAAGDEIQAEVTLKNETGAAKDVTELTFEERSVSFHVKATWNNKVKEYDLAIIRPDPHVALRLPLEKVTLANGKSISMQHRIQALAAGTLEITATYMDGAAALKSATVKVEVTGTSLIAVVDTTSGAVKIDLDHENAPANVSNFVSLAKRHFYDDMLVHRVVRGSWIHSGCPYGLGLGGPGYALRAELNPAAIHDEGTISMSSFEKKDYAGSQFFICLGKLPSLDNKYTVIGKVDASNLETVRAIGKVEVDKNTDRPKTEVKIKKVTISPK
jgi:cyclophilin family peptidyl-prolyl cis-trans isomerase